MRSTLVAVLPSLIIALVVVLIAPPAAAQDGMPDARAIFEGGLNAMGGRAALEAVESSRIVVESQLPLGRGQLTATMHWSRDGSAFVEQTVQGQSVTMGVHDGQGWVHLDATDSYELADDRFVKQVTEQAGMLTMLVRMADAFPEMQTVGQTAFAGRSCWKIALGPPREGANELRISKHHVFFDCETRLLAGQEYSEAQSFGTISVRLTYADWKPVGNLRIFRSFMMNRAALEAVTRLVSIELNGVPKETFELPAKVRELVAARSSAPATTAPATQPAGG